MFLDKLEIADKDECWNWRGSLRGGYGQTSVPGDRTPRPVHRVVYALVRGPIPDGLDLDHLCRNRACANPHHLEPVTRRVNLLRGDTAPARNVAKTHCVNGHAFDEANTYHWRGARYCRKCRSAAVQRIKQRKAAVA